MSQIGNMGGPTPRRSTRLSTKASSVAEESAVTNVTNGGTRLRRKGPLTKVKARKSNAYGASGRVGAAEELSVSATGFAQAFQNQRGTAVDRDDEDEDEEDEDDVDELGRDTPLMSGALNGNTHRFSPSPHPELSPRGRRGLSFLESEDVTPSEDDLNGSMANTTKSFGLEGGMLLGNMRQPDVTPIVQKSTVRRTFQTQIQSRSRTQAPATPVQASTRITSAKRDAINQSVDELIAEEQARLRQEGVPRPQPQPRSGQPQQQLHGPVAVNEWLGIAPPRNEQPHHDEELEWHWKKPLTWAFWSLLAILLLSLASLTMMSNGSPNPISRVGTHISNAWDNLVGPSVPHVGGKTAPMGSGSINDASQKEMEHLRTRVHDAFAVEIEKLNVKSNAMDSVLKELSRDLPDTLVVHQLPNGQMKITDDFWAALLSKAKSEGDSLGWVEFLKQNREQLEKIYGRTFDKDPHKMRPMPMTRYEFNGLLEEHYKKISILIDEKTQFGDLSKMTNEDRLLTLARMNVNNFEIKERKANYFSPGLGTIVDPALTSATFLDNPTYLGAVARRFGLTPRRNPPQAALSEWNEPGDCWCSAPDTRRQGHAQLAVSLSHSVLPTHVTIEHVPKSRVPESNISNAPRDVELWVETTELVNFLYKYHEEQCQEGPPGWKCMGTFKYNAHAENHMQMFKLDGTITVPISKAMVRVVTNWGSDHTCLYRVRLHGNSPKEHEYTTFLDSPKDWS